MEPLLTTKDVSKILNLTVGTVLEMIHDGRLPKPLNFGTVRKPNYRFKRDTLESFLSPEPAPQPKPKRTRRRHPEIRRFV